MKVLECNLSGDIQGLTIFGDRFQVEVGEFLVVRTHDEWTIENRDEFDQIAVFQMPISQEVRIELVNQDGNAFITMRKTSLNIVMA
jgi:hypothetical protein